MTTDLSQFHDAFFEESLEAVDDMETGLLNLDIDNVDPESINTIFRAAHSIKGCSATFGFQDISEFVHVMETVLDEMRDGNLKPDQTIVDLLLKALDVLREMLTLTRNEQAVDKTTIAAVHMQLTQILNKEKNASSPAETQSLKVVDTGEAHPDNIWKIVFTPHMNILKSGNDPLRMFSVLSDYGDITVESDVSGLLSFRVIEPEDCYLSWTITLAGEVSRAQIVETFEWVADDCDLSITQIQSADSNPAAQKSEQPAVTNLPVTSPEPEQPRLRRKTDRKDHEMPVSPASGSSDSASIRVGTSKVDEIINMVGELVITQSMLEQLGIDIEEGNATATHYEKLRSGLVQLKRNTRELQESVMRMRMLPISYIFNRVPRIVHDLSKKLNKEVNIKMTGESTELDKTVLEKIGDPLVHLIRNSLDHGIESPSARKAQGKTPIGTIALNAYHKGGNIIVEIKDDGAGLNKAKIIAKAKKKGLIENEETVTDEQVADLIFHAGLSTAETISDVSGRGVGMDVVRKNIKSLGGNIEVKSTEGVGTSFVIRLPLTLAILDGQLIRVGSETYIIPLVSIIESLKIEPSNVSLIAGQASIYRLRDEHIPFLKLSDLFGVQTDYNELDRHLMVIVEGDGKHAGLVIDELLAQQQVVIKSLETNFRRVDGLSGATILGDGTVALIVDVAGLINLSYSKYIPGNVTPQVPAEESARVNN